MVPRFIPPCLPSPADRPPSGPGWIHEIKHDGFRMMVRRDPAGVVLLTHNGHDWTGRFPLIAEAAGALKMRSARIRCSVRDACRMMLKARAGVANPLHRSHRNDACPRHPSLGGGGEIRCCGPMTRCPRMSFAFQKALSASFGLPSQDGRN